MLKTKELFNKCKSAAKESSAAIPLLEKVEKLLNTDNPKDIDEANQILKDKHKFKYEEYFDIRDIKIHKHFSGKKLLRIETIETDSLIKSLCISPNGNYFFIGTFGHKNSLKIISSHLKKTVYTYKKLKFTAKRILGSHDSEKIACIGYFDNRVLIYNTYSGRKTQTLKKLYSYVYDIKFSPDGKYLAYTGYNKTMLWNTETWKVEKTFISSNYVCFHPQGNYIASATEKHIIELTDINTGKRSIISGKNSNNIHELWFSADGKMLICNCYDNKIHVWDVKTAKLLYTLPEQDNYWKCCISPDGKILASILDSGTIKLTSLATGKHLITITGIKPVEEIAFHPSGDYIVVANSTKLVLIFLKQAIFKISRMTIPDFINRENEQLKKTKQDKPESEETEEYRNFIKGEELYWKGLNEEHKQKKNKFWRNFDDAVILYSESADFGNKKALERLYELG